MKTIDIVIKIITLILNVLLIKRTISRGITEKMDNVSALILIYDVLYWIYLILI